ncbi:S-adenosyl-L-methionine-dependent methyltransferase [Zopfia rhizophila CBS 207.26]|uniref:S-adenosyl-L-methionine-dependent methyltransferase n=1 Tax=Zopfia rhizophila CBS 207.26 TaxID=1314779 RepID=A0A6A6DR70_9PEZI|nr:S-adenosyl-L-methionine-dependent methyltransferase [Zopfia rhizophila CBS 207.26]
MASNASSLLNLAQTINTLTSDIKSHLSTTNHPEPDFTTSSADVPQDAHYASLRDSLNDAALDLLQLVNGPKQHFRRFLCSHNDLAAYQVAFSFSFFTHVPEKEPISLSALAEKVGLDEDRVGRTLRLLCTQHVFSEPSKNTFAHTSSSIIFARDKDLRACAEYQLDEMFKAASDTASGIRNGKSPFEERHGVGLFEFYGRDPKLAARFASAMTGVAKLDRQISELLNGYPWEELEGGKVVDVGGGSGHVSIALARAFPNLNIVVQDASPQMLAQAQQLDLSDLVGRISFMQHNFFTAQLVEDADAYFIRQCLHNWSDEQCVIILKALVPAMEKCRPGTPLLINDTIIPAHGTGKWFQEHGLRQMDMLMLVALGAKQRTEEEFRQLLERADERFEIVKVHSEGTMGLLEVHLNMESANRPKPFGGEDRV